MWPKPAQPGGPKIVLGGGWGPKLFRAIAEWGDGWMPITARPTLKGRVEGLVEACERAGRDPAAIELDAIGAAVDATALASLRSEGVHRAILTVWDEGRDDALRSLDRFAEVKAELG